MFEKIILSRSHSGSCFTLGEIAEAMFYYQNVHLVLDYSSMHSLIQKIGSKGFFALLSRPNVSAVYCEEILGTQTEKNQLGDKFLFVGMTIAGHKEQQFNTRKKKIEHIFNRSGNDPRLSKKFAERFLQRVQIRSLVGDHFVAGGVVKAAAADLNDSAFIHEALRRSLTNYLGEDNLIGAFKFEILPADTMFQINTDLNFIDINSKLKAIDPSSGGITAAHLLNEILVARADTTLAAHYGGEFYTSEASSQIIRLRHDELLKRTGISKEEIRVLHEITMPDAPTIKETIDSGNRTFDEFLSLLDKSHRFKEWMVQASPDEKLVKLYYQELKSEGWTSSLPCKALRYLLGLGIGTLDVGFGAGFSAADTFLLDKVFKGWTPSHFVERRLKPFVGHD